MAATESLVKTRTNSQLRDCGWTALGAFGVLRVRGADAVAFLQGQVSNDVALLGPGRSLLAGYHNPQGRVIALLRLLQLAPDDVIAVLPRELVGVTAQRLARFILRAKVKLADESAQWTVTGLMRPVSPADTATPDVTPPHRAAPPDSLPPAVTTAAPGPLAGELPASLGEVVRSAESLAVRVGLQPARWLLLSAAAQQGELAGGTPVTPQAWLRLAIAAGEPQVYAATSEEFVAQMLNLDAIGAIAFDKGCYTGQEVIARAHYRGRVKRRLQRFRTRAARRLTAGDAGELTDGRLFRVVSAVALAEGGSEFLAVAQLPTEGGEATRSQPADAAHVLEAEQLALPYPLPV